MGPIGAAYLAIALITVVLSYGFVDANLHLSGATWFTSTEGMLYAFTHTHRVAAALVYGLLVVGLYWLWGLLRVEVRMHAVRVRRLMLWAAGIYAILALSYPATSYDLFNYMAMAKLTYHWRENPYVVMPVEIPNDPVLAYTRAANKVALYGPTWIAVSAIPHTLGMENVWLTMVMFRLTTAAFVMLTCYLLYRMGGGAKAIAFFAFNPLTILEVGMSGHNDIVMVTLVLVAWYGLATRRMRGRVLAFAAFVLSVAVKGASVVLAPLAFVRWQESRRLTVAFFALLAVFLVAAPIREELYPWYAVWFIPFAALLYGRSYRFIPGATGALTLGLLLRHAPYMAMGYYEGPGPVLRLAVTVLPVVLYLGWQAVIRFGRGKGTAV